MSNLIFGLLVVSGLVLGIGIFSRSIRHSILSAPLVALLAGILLGPVTGVADIVSWGELNSIMESAALLTLALGLMGTAIQLPNYDVLHRWRTLAVLLGIVMPLGGIISGSLIFGISGVPLVAAMLIGAIVAPTDPILARSITSGDVAEEAIPRRIRFTILGESGVNDGLASPFVMLVVTFLHLNRSLRSVRHWLVHSILWETVGGIALGLLLGYAAGVLLHWAERRNSIDRSFIFSYPIALSLFVVAVAAVSGCDGLLAVFFAGVTFAASRSNEEQTRHGQVQEIINHFLVLPVFFLLGLAIPWRAWGSLGWGAFLIPVSILLLRRLPTVLTARPLMRRQLHNRQEAAFLGWFGPIGISALYYSVLARHRTGLDEVWVISTLIIVASIAAFGITDSLFTRMMWWDSEPETDATRRS